jgi:aminoglycoside 6'-N-acetyltransferase I
MFHNSNGTVMDPKAEFSVRIAELRDLKQLARMRSTLWPEASAEAHAQDLAPVLEGAAASTMPVINLVAETSDRLLIGFLEAGLRSHADGCDTSRPVGYIEGWYVSEEFRHRGVGSKLLAAAEDWARAHGCREMASDALIENEGSQRAHEALGYVVVDRCVHYRKTI